MKSAHDPGEVAVLGDEEAFLDDHLGEAALVLIADGAGDLVSARARHHAESCAQCAAAIGAQALAASELQTAFEAMAPAERERLTAPSRAHDDRSALVLRHVAVKGRGAGAARPIPAGVAPSLAQDEGATSPSAGHPPPGAEEPSSARRRAGGGAWWIAGGLVVAALASAPSLSGLLRDLAATRDALLVFFDVGVQMAESISVDPGRLGVVRATASWASTLAMIAVGIWIARHAPRGVAVGTEPAEAEGTR